MVTPRLGQLSAQGGEHIGPRHVVKPGIDDVRLLPPVPALVLTQDLDRDINERKSYRTEQEIVRNFLKNQRRRSPTPRNPVATNNPAKPRNTRIVGEYELEVRYYHHMLTSVNH